MRYIIELAASEMKTKTNFLQMRDLKGIVNFNSNLINFTWHSDRSVHFIIDEIGLVDC